MPILHDDDSRFACRDSCELPLQDPIKYPLDSPDISSLTCSNRSGRSQTYILPSHNVNQLSNLLPVTTRTETAFQLNRAHLFIPPAANRRAYIFPIYKSHN